MIVSVNNGLCGDPVPGKDKTAVITIPLRPIRPDRHHQRGRFQETALQIAA